MIEMKEELFSYLEDGQYEEAKGLLLQPFTDDLKKTHQNPKWHGEDDVLTHTDMVVEELLRLPEFSKLEKRKKNELFCAAVLHDIGKPACTKQIDGVWKSPHHAVKGAMLAREYLWRDFGMAGKPELMQFRETVCLLICYHDDPLHFMKYADVQRRIRRIAANGELVPDFSLEMLHLLSQADTRGRICEDKSDSITNLELFAELCKDLSCFDKPYPFPDDHTEFSYLNGKNITPELPFYNDTWGEVILMSALPGTGKDTYIKEHFSYLPMVSPDEIRKELGIRPTGNQGKVITLAKERAKELLRAHQPFVWNATCTTDDMRKQQIDLFAKYGASVRIVYLETGWEECLSRNLGRKESVPERIIEKLLHSLVVPERYEATKVEWKCV